MGRQASDELGLFAAKRRAPHKRHAMVGNYELHREVHVLDRREQEMVDAIAIDAGPAAPRRRRDRT
ncbi:hypothetical protein SRB17_88750 [Streptomyces sp. RB17]|uniref:hypothetical protein n=1 Tax=Streptomyces sp. RB17 TaxID=2585197 RepID=UPI0013061C70|nr:hypothetical protein [Streptomyces sp. RB17]MQY40842.1 hypothetical protein [Streptomyces sp. RB17]